MRSIPAPIGRAAGAVAMLLLGCAPAHRAYVAPTSQTIISSTEESQSGKPEHVIYVQNHATVPVTVFSVTLSGCENVKQRCGPEPRNLRVGPGQRTLVARVTPESELRGFGYRFNFSWRADSSSTTALRALAANGDKSARAKLAAMERADSLARTEQGVRYNELSPDDFAAIASRAVSLRADPDSLVLAPGTRTSIERIRVLLVDSQGVAFGRTRWLRWQAPSSGAVQFLPPDAVLARRPGRAVFRFALAEEAQGLLANPIADLELPVVVAYPHNPEAPHFEGLAEDAESGQPMACARVALEDSLQNVVARNRTDGTGVFFLRAPYPGTFRVRVEAAGWAPVYGPPLTAGPNETKQHKYIVRFTEQLVASPYAVDSDDFEHAYPQAVAPTPPRARPRRAAARPTTGAAPSVQRITLGGSPTMPILGIAGGAPARTMWMQFVVDSVGRVDSASIHLPRDAHRTAVANVRHVLPHVRFAPARDAGKPTCELLRMQVNFTPAR